MKSTNSNPMGPKANTGGATKPDGAVLRMMTAKMSPQLNSGNKVVPKQAKLNPPTAKTTGRNVMAPGSAPKPGAAKLNRKARTS